MNDRIYQCFVQGIYDKEQLVITYFSQKDQVLTSRTIAPLDYGPRYKKDSNEFAADGKDFFCFYDFDGSNGGHITLKDPIEIKGINTTNSYFDPAQIITLPKKHPWHISRDWGAYS